MANVPSYEEILAQLKAGADKLDTQSNNMHDVLVYDENSDIDLGDGEFTPSLSKRVKQFVTSTGDLVLSVNNESGHVVLGDVSNMNKNDLMKAENLYDDTESQKDVNKRIISNINSIEDLKNYKPNNTKVNLKSYFKNDNTIINELMIYDSTLTTFDDVLTFKSNVVIGGWKWENFYRIVQGGVKTNTIDLQDSVIIDIFNALKNNNIRKEIKFDKGIKFTLKNIFDNSPVGIVLKIEDFVNWGQSNYLNKFDVKYSSDLVTDDTSTIFASNHHPAIHLLNTGTSGSHSGNSRVSSILHSVGITSRNDPLNAQILQFGANSTGNKWQIGIRALIPYDIAMKDPVAWVSGKSYEIGDMCLSDGNKVYISTNAGISGNNAPAGTSTNISDGAIIWNYYAASRSKDSTTFTLDEDGEMASYGESYQIRNAANRLIFNVSKTSGDITISDYNNNKNILASNVAQGIYHSGVESLYFQNASGSNPTISSGAIRLSQTTVTNVTGFTLPIGQVSGVITVDFVDAKSTLKHSSALVLKGAVDVKPPAGSLMQFVRNGPISSAWRELSRNF